MNQELIDQIATSALTEQQIKAIAAVIGSANRKEAIERSGVSRSTFYRWYGDPVFRQAVISARREFLQEVWSEAKQRWEERLLARTSRRRAA